MTHPAITTSQANTLVLRYIYAIEQSDTNQEVHPMVSISDTIGMESVFTNLGNIWVRISVRAHLLKESGSSGTFDYSINSHGGQYQYYGTRAITIGIKLKP